jgi:hypothetical protein
MLFNEWQWLDKVECFQENGGDSTRQDEDISLIWCSNYFWKEKKFGCSSGNWWGLGYYFYTHRKNLNNC